MDAPRCSFSRSRPRCRAPSAPSCRADRLLAWLSSRMAYTPTVIATCGRGLMPSLCYRIRPSIPANIWKNKTNILIIMTTTYKCNYIYRPFFRHRQALPNSETLQGMKRDCLPWATWPEGCCHERKRRCAYRSPAKACCNNKQIVTQDTTMYLLLIIFANVE